jgi:hypothetical protein
MAGNNRLNITLQKPRGFKEEEERGYADLLTKSLIEIEGIFETQKKEAKKHLGWLIDNILRVYHDIEHRKGDIANKYIRLARLHERWDNIMVPFHSNPEIMKENFAIVIQLLFRRYINFISKVSDPTDAFNKVGYFIDLRNIFPNKKNKDRINLDGRGILIPVDYVSIPSIPAQSLQGFLNPSFPKNRAKKPANVLQSPVPRFPGVASMARKQLGGPRTQKISAIRQLPRLNNLMPNTSRRARNTKGPGNTRRVIQTGVPPPRPSYANMARGVPLSPAPFPLSPLVSQEKATSMKVESPLLAQEEPSPCPPGQEEYTDNAGDKACCDPQDIWMVRLGNKVYTICGVLHGPETKTKELSPPIDIEDSPELEQLSMATSSPSPEKPPSPHRCQQHFTKMNELREKIERTGRFLTRAKTYRNIKQKQKQTRRLTTRLKNLRKLLTKRVRSFQSGCVPTVLSSNSPLSESPTTPPRRRTTVLKKSRTRLIRSLLLAWLALVDAPKLNTGSGLVPYVNLDNPTDFTLHAVPMGSALVPLGALRTQRVVVPNEQQTGFYGTTAPFRGPPPVMNMGTGLVPVGPLRNLPVAVPNEAQRGYYETTAPFRGPPPVVNMGSAVVPVGPLRTHRVIVPNEAQRGSYGTVAPFRPAPPVVNMGSAVVPVGPLRNLPVAVPNEAQRGSYGTNAPYAPPENVVLSNTSGTGRFITENGKTYFVQEISWAGTRYKIKVFVDKDTTGRQLYDKAYEALRDQVGFFQQAAIRFKGKVDKLTNIEGKIISRNNTKIL